MRELKVLIEEEYGYRYWSWSFPGTAEELVAEWKAGRTPNGIGYVYCGEFKGTITQIPEPICTLTPEEEALPVDAELSPERHAECLTELENKWRDLFAQHDAFAFIHEPEDSWIMTEVDGAKKIPWTAPVDHDYIMSDLLAAVLGQKKE